MSIQRAFRLALALGPVILIAAACGGSGPTGPGPTPAASATPAAATKFTGTIAGISGQSGSLVISIAAVVSASSEVRAQAAATATATLTVINGGGSFALTGTFDDATRALTLSGSGFSLAGTIAGGQVTGHYTGPGGSEGVFSTLNSTSQSVQPWCGSYHRVTEDGVWNFQVAASGEITGTGASIIGSGPSANGETVFFTGSRSGNAVDFTVRSHDGETHVTGTIQGVTVGGSFTDNHGLPGTFTGGTC